MGHFSHLQQKVARPRTILATCSIAWAMRRQTQVVAQPALLAPQLYFMAFVCSWRWPFLGKLAKLQYPFWHSFEASVVASLKFSRHEK